jgi:hypothetical protein
VFSVSNLVYSSPVWDDVRIPMSSLRSGVTPPTAKEFIGGIRAWAFDKAVDDMLEGELQVPHGVNTNYYIALHLHYAVTNAATTTNGVVWGIEYTKANPNRVFNSPSVTTIITNFPGTNLLHKVVSVVNVSNCTDSAVIMVRLYRDADNLGDTHDDDAYALSLDAHFVRWRPGSLNENGDY